MRQNIAAGITALFGLAAGLFGLYTWGWIAVHLYWPLLQQIYHHPVSAIWWLPLGCMFGSLIFYVSTLIWGVVIGLPAALLARLVAGSD